MSISSSAQKQQRGASTASGESAAALPITLSERSSTGLALLRILGDFDVAEELVQDALLLALEHWPLDGIPERPGAWLLTVARRRALNQLSRDTRYREKLAQLEQPVPREPDERLRLMFTCCHPALSRTPPVASAPASLTASPATTSWASAFRKCWRCST